MAKKVNIKARQVYYAETQEDADSDDDTRHNTSQVPYTVARLAASWHWLEAVGFKPDEISEIISLATEILPTPKGEL